MKKNTHGNIFLIPLVLWFIVIPLIVKEKFYANPMLEYPWFDRSSTCVDFFLYYKSIFISFAGIVMLVLMFYHVRKTKQGYMIANSDSKIFIPIYIYIILAILSSVISNYSSFCVHGMPEQFEPIWNLIAYIIAAMYCYYMVVNGNCDRKMLLIVCIGAMLVGLVCVLQYFKMDIYRAIYSGQEYGFVSENGAVYGPFYNINYVGYYVLLFIPVFFSLAIYLRKIQLRIVLGLLCLALLIALVGADSLAAELALMVVIFFAILFLLFKNVKQKRGFWLPIIALLVSAAALCVISAPRIHAYVASSNTEKNNLENIFTNDADVEIDYKGQKLFVRMLTKSDHLEFSITDQNQQQVSNDYNKAVDGYYYYAITDSRFEGITLTPAIISRDPVRYGFEVLIDDKKWRFTNQTDMDDSYYYYTDLGTLTKLTKDTPSVDFEPLKNKSSLANGRGYIWNKTITMLKKYMILGSGADTFALVYPNDDYVDKYNNGYDNIIITKPHSLYLQIAIQSGGVSLICFLVFYFWYFISSVRLYFRQQLNQPLSVLGFGILLGTMGYMISGLANDSSVTVAPLYWGLMGMGIGINHRIRSTTN